MNRKIILPTIIVLGLLSLSVVMFLVIRGVGKSQRAFPSSAATNWQHFEDTDPKITYHLDPRCWKVVTGPGASYHQADHRSPAKPFCQPIWNEWAAVDTTGTGVFFDQMAVGYGAWDYGDKINVKLDGSDFTQFDTFAANVDGNHRFSKKWTSATFSCGEHTFELHPIQNPHNGALTLTLDYVEIHTCTPASFLICQNSACAISSSAAATDSGCLSKNSGDSCTSGGTFLICQDNACKLSSDVSATDSACLSKKPGDSCGGRGGGDTTLNCQGNPHPSAKCFDCKIDNPASGSSQINILDFSCFAKDYGQNVGISK